MNTNNVLNGQYGHVATGFAKSALLNQLGFIVGGVVTTKANPKNDIPLMDAGVAERLKAATGDSGQQQARVYDVMDLVDGHAAAYLLVQRHVLTPNPEDGRKDEHLRKWLVSPAGAIIASAEYKNNLRTARAKEQAIANNMVMYGKFATKEDGSIGECTNLEEVMLKAKPRLDAIEKEAAAVEKIDVGTYELAWINAIEKYAKMDNQDLIDRACEALTDAGRNVGLELKKAANALIDDAKKRNADGKFVKIDTGIWAMAREGSTATA